MPKHETASEPEAPAPAILTGKAYDHEVSAPAYFSEHNIREAAHIDWCNRAWLSNRINAMGNAIRGAKRDHLRKALGDDKLVPTTKDLDAVTVAEALAMTDHTSVQSWFTAICADFDPSATRTSAETVDPVTKEALDIASKAFDDFLTSKSIKPGALKTTKLPDGTNKYKALLGQYIDRKGMDHYRAQAVAAIEARKAASADEDFDLDGALDTLAA